MKARTVLGRGRWSLLCDAGSEFFLGRERKDKCEDNASEWDEQNKIRVK